MNINRIFDNKPDFGKDGEITLSNEYAKDDGGLFSTVKPVCAVDAEALMICGMPIVFKDGAISFDAVVVVKLIVYIFELSEEEAKKLKCNDYMKLLSYIVDGFADDIKS